MTDNGLQPYLPFDESTDDSETIAHRGRSQPLKSERVPSQRALDRRPPTSLAAFAAAWDCAEPESAMRRACHDLRARANQRSAPYALTPMLVVLSAVRADAPQAIGAHGRLHASATGWTVYRRTDQPWRRVRFTEAHELGHILLYEKLAFNRQWLENLHSDAAHLQVEKLCDLAAAELLIPDHDLSRDLETHPLQTLSEYHWFYDRYMTSHRTLLRRVAEVTENTALTVWSWQTHRNGANWRVQESYCQKVGDIYIPRGLSRRHLNPDIVGRALGDGAATAYGCIDVRHRRYTGVMTALYPGYRNQRELPVYNGRAIGDEQGGSVYVLHRDLASTTIPAVPSLRRSGRAS